MEADVSVVKKRRKKAYIFDSLFFLFSFLKSTKCCILSHQNTIFMPQFVVVVFPHRISHRNCWASKVVPVNLQRKWIQRPAVLPGYRTKLLGVHIVCTKAVGIWQLISRLSLYSNSPRGFTAEPDASPRLRAVRRSATRRVQLHKAAPLWAISNPNVKGEA